MIVLAHADLILDETYLVSTEARGYIREPEDSPFQPIPTAPLPLPEDSDLLPFLPDLIPAGHRDGTSPGPLQFAQPSKPHQGREQLTVEMGHEGVMIRDLVHPALTDPLRNHQNSTFKMIKLVSDFNYQLSKLHEQHATDMAHLVETFRKKTNDIQSNGPRSVNTLANAWEQWMADVMQDSACHTEISAALGRNVAKPLLEKTFHMKIQSRKVFTQREAFERLLADGEDRTTKSHMDFRKSWTQHVEQQDPHSLASYLENHNAYVGQIHNINGMIDQYYGEGLPHLLQELDDVYHDVSGVVLESLTEGCKKITEKTENMTARWQKTGEAVRTISAEKDLASFLTSITIPDYVPITRHIFAPPPPKEVTKTQQSNQKFMQNIGGIKEAGLPLTTCEIILDRTVSATARNRYEQLKTEEKDLEGNIRLNSEAVESLIRIQAKNLDQQLFNKANEIQEDISKKRYDLRLAQIRLSGTRAQKILFAATEKQTDESLCAVEGVTAGGPSEKSTGKMKSKWVNAFKNVKGKKDPSIKPVTPVATAAPPVLDNSHQFQEYTYKNITPCDVCSQIMRGHARQGLKCKLCRMNVHPECQEKVVKCQPKDKLQRRPGSEMGDNDTGFSPRASVDPGAPSQRRQSFVNSKPPSTDTLAVPGQPPDLQPGDSASARRKMGGSYSRYTGPGLSRGLTIDGDLVDSSGRKINPAVTGNGVLGDSQAGSRVGSVGPTSRNP
eukprot:GFUD01009909.1.p1 GENE.GFUD01009909.1~~GFUD01009909.1.p1  ORF type:complete len:726 (-),score=191.16 GFUD01009909.1:343-2520(-)